METTDIRTHNDLLLQLANLRYQKTIQQANLKVSIAQNWDIFNLISVLLKGKIKNAPETVFRNGLNAAICLGIDLLMGKPRNIKKVLGTLLLENVSMLLMNASMTKVTSAIFQYIIRKIKY